MAFPSTGLDDGLIGVFDREGSLYRENVTPGSFSESRVVGGIQVARVLSATAAIGCTWVQQEAFA